MGYTHYWGRVAEFEKVRFGRVVEDSQKVVRVLSGLGVVLAGGLGTGKPEVHGDGICFNGKADCGHARRNLGITWPSAGARAVGLAYVKGEAEEVAGTLVHSLTGREERLATKDSDVQGVWFAGLELKTRTCDGDCSHESFRLSRVFRAEEWQKPEHGMYFEFCKTAFKPYDLAVTACLIVAKHHLGGAIVVKSDGELDAWKDAMRLCQHVLGYGGGFGLDE